MLHKRTTTPVSVFALSVKRLALGLIALGLTGIPLLVSAPVGAVPITSVTLNVTLRDNHVGQQDTVTVSNLDNDVLGTCQLNTTARTHTAICAVTVPVNKSVVLAAQSATGERLTSYTGSGCASAPGPVCHIAVDTKNQSVSARFATAQPGPSITTAQPLVYAGSPTLSLADIGYAGYDDVQVSGSDFPASTAATLTDDGTVVATGKTDGGGAVTLSYTAQSEPGIYRNLAIRVGNESAATDVYNTLVWSWGEGDQGSGQPFFVVNETNMDANKVENYVQFDSNTPVPITFTDGSASQGYAQIQTPPYTCAAGTNGTLTIYGTRGTGAQRYTYSFAVPVTC